MFNLFSRNKQVVNPTRTKKKSKRSFMGAKPSAMHKFNADYSKINNELRSDGIALVLRARSLVKNNSVAASFIQMMIRNIIGSAGFRLEVTSYNEDGSPDTIANKIIQDYWYEYTKMGNYVEITESMTENEFDKMILFSLLVDGECFLRKHRDPTSKFGIRYELIDSLDVDNLKNGEFNDGSRVVLGIRVDKHYKPISYFIRENPSPDYYLQGQTVEVPASEVIHIYKRTFPNQVRGYSIFAPAMLNMASLEQYSRSELQSSILSATLEGIWIKTGTSDTDYSQYDEDEIDENGDVATQIEPGCLKYAPQGYDLKQLSVNHPNNNYSNFTKHICKSIASALGISYNKMLGDYESVNYSSLRAAALEDNETYRDYQQFLINAWKNVQYYEFLKYLLLTK